MKICPQCHRHFNQQNWHCPDCRYTPPLLNGHLTFAPELAAASEGFEAQFFPKLAQLEAKNFWFITCSGSEIFTAGLEFATERLRKTTLFQMDARNIPFAEEFDIIGAFDVLEHIEQDTDVLEKMYQATQNGGV